MKNDLTYYKKLIEKSNQKFTIQKKIILEEIINAEKHISAKEIYEKVREKNIGLATVYRALKLFVEIGIIKEIKMDDASFYELRIFGGKPLHVHFKCIKCNKIQDIDNKELILEYIKINKKIEQANNIDIFDADIMLIGMCDDCRNKTE